MKNFKKKFQYGRANYGFIGQLLTAIVFFFVAGGFKGCGH